MISFFHGKTVRHELVSRIATAIDEAAKKATSDFQINETCDFRVTEKTETSQ